MVAARFLQRHGIEILARNVAVGPGELDILARQGTRAWSWRCGR